MGDRVLQRRSSRGKGKAMALAHCDTDTEACRVNAQRGMGFGGDPRRGNPPSPLVCSTLSYCSGAKSPSTSDVRRETTTRLWRSLDVW